MSGENPSVGVSSESVASQRTWMLLSVEAVAR